MSLLSLNHKEIRMKRGSSVTLGHSWSAQEPPGMSELRSQNCPVAAESSLRPRAALALMESRLASAHPPVLFIPSSSPGRAAAWAVVCHSLHGARSCRGTWRGGVCFGHHRSTPGGGLQACGESPAAVGSRHSYLSGETRGPDYRASQTSLCGPWRFRNTQQAGNSCLSAFN